jgi:adenylate cyclase
MSLARLGQARGERRLAHQTLAEVYAWFTEGFDTSDLTETRTLLEELS